jgi:hypothetical protein
MRLELMRTPHTYTHMCDVVMTGKKKAAWGRLPARR